MNKASLCCRREGREEKECKTTCNIKGQRGRGKEIIIINLKYQIEE